MDITEFRKQYPQYDDVNNMELSKMLHKKFYSDVPFNKFIQDFGVITQKQPTFTQQMSEEFQRGFAYDIEKAKQTKQRVARFASGLREKIPQMAAATVATAIPLLPNVIPCLAATPEEVITIPAGITAGQAVKAALTRMLLAGVGGGTGRTGQEIYRAVTDKPTAAKTIGEAVNNIEYAFEEEFLGQGLGEIGSVIISKALSPFAQKATPGYAELSRKLSQAATRIPEEELIKLPPSLQKQLLKKTLLPRLYRTSSGQFRFGRVPKLNVILTPAQRTISPSLDWIESAIEGSVFGGGKLKVLKKYLHPVALKQLTSELNKEMWEQAGRRLSDEEVAGLFVDAITGSKDAWRSQQKMLYSMLDDVGTVSNKAVKEVADELIEKASKSKGLGSSSAILRLANKAKKLSMDLSFSDGIAVRSDMLEEVYKYESITGLKSPKLRGAGQRLVDALDSAMAKTAKSHSDETYQIWRKANAVTREGYGQFQKNNLTRALKLANENPAKLADVFFGSNSAESIRELKELVPADTFKNMRAGWLEKQIIDSSNVDGILLGKTFKNKISQQTLGVNTLNEIFPDKQLYKDIMDVAEIAHIFQDRGAASGKMVMQLTQSGQVIMTGANIMAGKPAKTGTLASLVVTPLMLGRLFTTRSGAKLLSEGFKTPVWSPQAAGLIIRIMKAAEGPKPIAPITTKTQKTIRQLKGQKPLRKRLSLTETGKELMKAFEQ
jgi:hypothetical protein